jgi:hypothetical protein
LRAIVSLISAIAVFVHAAVGCCAHHAHADFGAAGCPDHRYASDITEYAGHEHGHSEADGGDHNSAAGENEDRDQHGPSGGECDGTRCLGIRGAKAPGLEAAGGVWAKFTTTPQVELTGGDAIQAPWLMGHSFAPPVRRHLAHCVLLI